MKSLLALIMTGLIVSATAVQGFAAVGCTLNDPDRDIMRIFPNATNYKTEFITIDEFGGDATAKTIESLLGDTLDDVFETTDVPYAYYTVLKGKDVIGHVHGVNQKGLYGGMQLILATDPNGVIVDFYYQKISSPEAKAFRKDEFTAQFDDMTLDSFLSGQTNGIEDPSNNNHEDFVNTIRGLKKNLILLDIFKLDRKYSGGNDDE